MTYFGIWVDLLGNRNCCSLYRLDRLCRKISRESFRNSLIRASTRTSFTEHLRLIAHPKAGLCHGKHSNRGRRSDRDDCRAIAEPSGPVPASTRPLCSVHSSTNACAPRQRAELRSHARRSWQSASWLRSCSHLRREYASHPLLHEEATEEPRRT